LEKTVEDLSNRWKWPAFLFELTATDSEYDSILPQTDSRLRGDVRALKSQNMKLAGKEKTKIEEAERIKRKEREAHAVHWSPGYFKKVENEGDTPTSWEYNGESYWEERKQRKAQFKLKQSELKKQDPTIQDIKDTQEKTEESPRSP